MGDTIKALAPVKAGGKVIKPGGDIPLAVVGDARARRLIAKGRASGDVPDRTEAAPVNRADTQTGKPPLSSTGTTGPA